MKRKGWIVLLALVLLLAGCGSKTPEPLPLTTAEPTTAAAVTETTTAASIVIVEETTEAETTEAEELPEERVEIDGKIRSYLTGEMVPVEIGDRRPVAVMMSNDKEARPQYGMGRAGVVYEAPVEGVMNRYMSVIEDYDDLERIGSVRSCRTYYTYFAREWDAVYAHFGQSTFAVPYLKNVDNINGLEGIGDTAYYRSKDKRSPHNAYTSGERLKKSIDKLGYRNEYAESYQGHFLFAKIGEDLELDPDASLDAAKLVPGYPYNKPWFTYDESDGLYHRYQYEDVHRSDEGPIAVKNVIFQYSPAGFYATTQYLNINIHEDTYGYYFTNGRGIPVSVHKDGEFGVTHYYDPEGNEIRLNCGKTWICIIRAQDFSNTRIYGADGEQTN